MLIASLAAWTLLQSPPPEAPAPPPSDVKSPTKRPTVEGKPPPTAPATPTDGASAVTKLFDGKTLSGWKVFVPEGSAEGLWTVSDGVLVCTGQPVGYIATTEKYDNFELTLEWRFDPAKGAGNSGVLLRVDDTDQVWPKSIEAQLHSGNAGDIWNIGAYEMTADAKRTEGRRTLKLHPSNEKPIGEWNRYRIVVDGGKLELYVNDLLQNSATDVAERKGRIALQSEGAKIEFRSIELRPLRPATGVGSPAAPASERSSSTNR